MTTQTFTKQDVPASKLYLAIFLSAALFFFMISLLTGCYGAKDNEKEKSTIAAPAATPVRGTIIVIPAVYSDFSSPYKNKS